MSDTTADQIMEEVRTAVRDTVGPRSPGETMERAMERAAYRLGLSYSRVWSIWYRRVRVVQADEYVNIKARADARRRERIVELQAEIARLQSGADPSEEAPPRLSEGG